jgi:two-component system, OmpR family, sensor histidine kinase QseC
MAWVTGLRFDPMKLLTKYSRVNLLSSVVIFVLASIAFYILLRIVLINQVDEDLKIEEHEIEMYVEKFGKLPEPMPVKDQIIYYLPANNHTEEKTFSNTRPGKFNDNKKARYRELKFFISANGQWYQVFVQKSLEETENISRSIIIISLATIIAMLAAGFIINRLLLRRLWQPFYTSLSVMKDFRLGQAQNILFNETNIEEFNDLNKTLEQSIKRAESEYRQLMEFTENASHELQTPLAVVRSKMDVLIQDEKLSESQSHLVQTAYQAIQKMARLNQSMLLLNKIENRQFAESSIVDIRQLIEQKLIYFKELLAVQDIRVFAKLDEADIRMNPSLAEILLNNLFSNAIRYTPEGGSINIILNRSSMIFRNTAKNEVSLDTTKLFNRFYKGEQSSENHGLGLSIVQQICSASGFSIQYRFCHPEHIFEILFNDLH